MTKRYQLLIDALFGAASVTGILLAALAYLGSRQAMAAHEAEGVSFEGIALAHESTAEAIEKLTTDLEKLRATLAELEGQPTHEPGTSAVRAFGAELRALEARVAEVEERVVGGALVGAPESEQSPQDSQLVTDALGSYQATFLDPGQEEVVRLAALDMLLRFPEEIDALSERVLSEIYAMAASPATTKSTVRRLVLAIQARELPGGDEMLARIAGANRYGNVRAVAVNALSVGPNPGQFLQLFRHLAATDEDDAVREAARRAMARADQSGK